MDKFFKRENLKNIIFSTVYIIFGVLFFVMLSRLVDFFETALGIILIVVGVLFIIVFSFMPSDGKIYKVLIYGSISFVIGILIVVVPSFFVIALGLIIAYSGVMTILDAIKLKKNNDKVWIAQLVIGIIVSALSAVIIILSGTNVARNILAILLGATMLIEGIYNFVSLIKKSKEEPKEEVEKLDEK